MMNIAAVIRLHFIPESEGGSPELYKDIHFEKDKYSSFLQEMLGMMPGEICTNMNDALSGEDNENGMFVTFWLGLIRQSSAVATIMATSLRCNLMRR